MDDHRSENGISEKDSIRLIFCFITNLNEFTPFFAARGKIIPMGKKNSPLANAPLIFALENWTIFFCKIQVSRSIANKFYKISREF